MSEQTITVRPEVLAAGREVITFILTSLSTWMVRSLIVWGFLAIFFPTLGATFLLVAVALWVLRHVIPPSVQERVNAIKRVTENKTKSK